MRDRARHQGERLHPEHRALREVATADDVESGMRAVLAIVRDHCDAARVEWYQGRRRTARMVVGGRRSAGRRQLVSLGAAGRVVVVDGRPDAYPERLLAAVAPVLRRRCAEERLARAAIQLGRRNAALEEFAALVAHELKAPLQAALLAEDPGGWVRDALQRVDALLEAEREPGPPTASPAVCLDGAIRDLGRGGLAVTFDLPASLPLPATPLRVILRNLLANAIAAGAGAVHVSATRSADTWTLVVRDDGAGLEAHGGERGGSGLGLRLCRGIVRRYGGSLAVEPAVSGGTEARLQLKEAA